MEISKKQLSQWEESRGVLLGLLARYPYGDEGEAEYLTDAICLFYLVLGRKKLNIGDPTVKDNTEEVTKRQVRYYSAKQDRGLYRTILRLITHLMTPTDAREFPSKEHILEDVGLLERDLKSYAEFPSKYGYKNMFENCRSILKDEFTVFTPLKEEDYCTCLVCGKPILKENVSPVMTEAETNDKV